MKKLLILSLFLLCSVFSISSFADNTSVIDSLKSFIKDSLNSTVSVVKENFNNVETERKILAEDVDDLDDRVDVIKSNERSAETDGSVLKHGKAAFAKTCDYSKENLKWNGSKWDCVTAAPLSDCSPNSGEDIIENPLGSGNYKCIQKYTFSKVLGDWGVCNETLGEKHAYEECYYKNNMDNTLKYQVDGSYCSGLAKKVMPCNENSSCRCPAGLSFKYNSNNEIVGCQKKLTFTNPESDMEYTFRDGVLTWGKQSDSWRGTCKRYTRKIHFDYDPAVLTSLKLVYAWFDDYLWIRVNGRYVYGGPDDGMAEYKSPSYMKSGAYGPSFSCDSSQGVANNYSFCTKDNKMKTCERNKTWTKRPNLDLTRYLVRGRNTIEAELSVTGGGELITKFEFNTKAGTETSPPICDAVDRVAADWVTSNWSSCSKSCGGGTQTRSVTCPTGAFCPGVKPATSQSCNVDKCKAEWTIGDWSSCSKQCNGTQTRSVTCPSGFTCLDPKPATSQSCNVLGEQVCTYSCPSGYTLKGTKCESADHCRYNKSTDNVFCPSASCSDIYTWNGDRKCVESHSVGQCNGYRRGAQKETNHFGINYYEICGKDVIDAQTTCSQACKAEWKVYPWSSCSKSCGGGTQSRTVTCPTGFTCPDLKPATVQSCNTQACPEYTCPSGYALNGTKCYKDTCKRDSSNHGTCAVGGAGQCSSMFKNAPPPRWNGSEVYATTEQNVPYNAFYVKGSSATVMGTGSPACYWNCNYICKKGAVVINATLK